MTRCPKCDAELEVEEADPDVGIMSAGAYCDACDLAVDVEHEYHDDDVMLGPARAPGEPIGTPISELSGRPGPKDDIGHPDHARYANFCRIARSWGRD